MTDEEIVSEILSLPENLQEQVLQYIEFLKYKNSTKDEKEKNSESAEDKQNGIRL